MEQTRFPDALERFFMLNKGDQKYSQIVKYYYNINNCFLFEYILKCNLFLFAQLKQPLLQFSVTWSFWNPISLQIIIWLILYSVVNMLIWCSSNISYYQWYVDNRSDVSKQIREPRGPTKTILLTLYIHSLSFLSRLAVIFAECSKATFRPRHRQCDATHQSAFVATSSLMSVWCVWALSGKFLLE